MRVTRRKGRATVLVLSVYIVHGRFSKFVVVHVGLPCGMRALG